MVSKELIHKLEGKKKVNEIWKKGLTTWEEYRNVVRPCKDATMKAKAHLELNLSKEVKDNKRESLEKIIWLRKIWSASFSI